jgi:plasmid maintenance system antidote protein VapI
MSPNTSESIIDLLNEAKQGNPYWEEMAILNFTEAVVNRLEEIGMAKQELATKLGVSPGYITKLMGGENNFTLRTMVKVARAVGSELHVDIRPSNSWGRWRSYASDELHRLVVLPDPASTATATIPCDHETFAAAA